MHTIAIELYVQLETRSSHHFWLKQFSLPQNEALEVAASPEGVAAWLSEICDAKLACISILSCWRGHRDMQHVPTSHWAP
jgi:hypothetical protein